jgi:DNA-binding NarL/FixJ family response regulator
MVNRERPRAVVLEHRPIFDLGLVALLTAAGLDVVAVTDDAEKLIGTAAAHTPDVVVIDILRSPGLLVDALRAVRLIHSRQPSTDFLVLSQSPDDELAFERVSTCAKDAGYRLEDDVTDLPGGLLETIRRLSQRGLAVDQLVARSLVPSDRTNKPVDQPG